jgi:hypothetical protein
LSDWLQAHQPCLFGGIAAKHGALSCCILNESDLEQSDEAIREKIQTSRLEWTRQGFEGKKSGFIILAISPRIAYAQATPEDFPKSWHMKASDAVHHSPDDSHSSHAV